MAKLGIWAELTHLADTYVRKADRRIGLKYYMATLINRTKWKAHTNPIKNKTTGRSMDYWVTAISPKSNKIRVFIACFDIEEFPFKLPFQVDRLFDLKKMAIIFQYKGEIRKMGKSKIKQEFDESYFLKNSINIYNNVERKKGIETAEEMAKPLYPVKKKLKKILRKIKIKK